MGQAGAGPILQMLLLLSVTVSLFTFSPLTLIKHLYLLFLHLILHIQFHMQKLSLLPRFCKDLSL